MIINLMEASDKPSQANEYAVAFALHDQVFSIIVGAMLAQTYDLTLDTHINGLNRSYILLTAELQKIYDSNPELSSIKPVPLWKQFDTIKSRFEEIIGLIADSDNDLGSIHKARLERLYILSGEVQPDFTVEQKKVIEYAEKARVEFKKLFEDAKKKKDKIHVEYGWQIFEYNLTYKPDGTILINQALKLKKAHIDSAIDKLLEQAFKNPNTKFKPNLGKTSRNISTIISSAGFTPVLRDLFFPTVNNDVVVFRPHVSKLQADLEYIDRTELDLVLRENGALCRVVFEPN